MANVDWSDCPLVEVIPGKVSGVPLLEGHAAARGGDHRQLRRIPRRGVVGHEAIAETLDCYPEAGVDAIKAILCYRAEHQLQARH